MTAPTTSGVLKYRELRKFLGLEAPEVLRKSPARRPLPVLTSERFRRLYFKGRKPFDNKPY